jgi:riboflavin kinase/FMN adenylyltransferase
VLVVHDALKTADLPRGSVATIGSYDGIHRGQRLVLDQVVRRAAELGAPSLVLTFDPHPMKILHPDRAPARLSNAEQKERLLAEAGIEVAAIIRFTREVATMSADDFVKRFLAGRLSLREVHVGSGFRFGRDRDGDFDRLQELGSKFGFTAQAVEELTWRGERVSSSRIRTAVSEGRVEDAAEMLGHPFELAGPIVQGDRMGKRLGWPTVNLAADNELLPGDGVYVSRIFFPSFPGTFDCVTNIGTRPTLYENYERVVESHVLDFRADVYGEKARLTFLRRIREERIFASVMELSAQIGRDVETAREYFAARKRLDLETAAVEP